MLEPFHQITLRILSIFQLHCCPISQSTIRKKVKKCFSSVKRFKRFQNGDFSYFSRFNTEGNIFNSFLMSVVCLTQAVCFQCNFSWWSQFTEKRVLRITIGHSSIMIWCWNWFQIRTRKKGKWLQNWSLLHALGFISNYLLNFLVLWRLQVRPPYATLNHIIGDPKYNTDTDQGNVMR